MRVWQSGKIPSCGHNLTFFTIYTVYGALQKSASRSEKASVWHSFPFHYKRQAIISHSLRGTWNLRRIYTNVTVSLRECALELTETALVCVKPDDPVLNPSECLNTRFRKRNKTHKHLIFRAWSISQICLRFNSDLYSKPSVYLQFHTNEEKRILSVVLDFWTPPFVFLIRVWNQNLGPN